MLRTAAALALLGCTATFAADTDNVDLNVNAILQRLGDLEDLVEQQQLLLSSQQEMLDSLRSQPHESALVNANSIRSGMTRQRRSLLDIDADAYSGLNINRGKAGVFLGKDKDVALLRTSTYFVLPRLV